MRNLLDLMDEADRRSIEESYQKRMSGDSSYRKNMSIPPEIYLIAEFGYYYGWGAIEAAKRGYTEGWEVKKVDGKAVETRTKIPLTMEEVSILTEAARKIWYGKVVDNARGTLAASASVMSKKPADTFKKQMDVYAKRAEL